MQSNVASARVICEEMIQNDNYKEAIDRLRVMIDKLLVRFEDIKTSKAMPVDLIECIVTA